MGSDLFTPTIPPPESPRFFSFLVSLMESEAPWPVVQEAINLLEAGGQLKLSPPEQPWSPDQQHLLILLASRHCSRRFYTWALPHLSDSRISTATDWLREPAFADFLVSTFGVSALITPHAHFHQKSIAHTVLDALYQSGLRANPSDMSGLDLWIDKLPWNHLSSWVSNSDSVRTEPSSSLIQCLVQQCWQAARRDQARVQDAVLTKAIQAGGSLLGAAVNGKEPLAKLLSRPAHWDAYLEQGGDPSVLVTLERNDKIEKLPLWKSLITTSHIDDLVIHLKAWAEKNHPQACADLLQENYWRYFEERTQYSIGLDQLKHALKKDPKWFTFVDHQGRTPMMRAIVKHASAYKEFSAKKYAPHLAKRDQNGWSVAHHVLKDSKNITADVMSFLAASPEWTAPSSGNGVLALLALDQQALAQPGITIFNRWIKSTPADHWCAIAPQDRAAVLNFYANTVAPSHNVGCALQAIARHHRADITDPQLLGVLALHSLSDVGRSTPEGTAVVDDLVALGAQLPPMTEISREMWAKSVGSDLFSSLVARCQHNAMSEEVGANEQPLAARKKM